MTRHGKNNTASSVFTHAERMMTGNGSKKQRFTAHSMADFDSCRLCLSTARDPRVDTEGHLFCHECILEHILSQKKDLKRQRALLDRMNAEEASQKQAALAAARARVIQDFERAQAGILANSIKKSIQTSESSSVQSGASSTYPLSTKDELDALTTAAERAALETLEREALAARRSKLPNFWLPSLTPSAPPTRLSALPSTHLRPLCHINNRPGDHRPHPIKLADLVTVHFETEHTSTTILTSSKLNRSKCCAGCHKGLNKNSKLAVLNPCGDVVCMTCVKTLVRSKDKKDSEQCPKCDKEVIKVIELEREGTGFAAGGMAEAVKFDVAFQG